MSRKLIQSQIDLLKLAEGFFESRILFSLEKLGVFETLGRETKSLQELSKALDGRPDTLARLLNAGVVLKLLEPDGGDGYRIHPRWTEVLLPDAGESYLGNWVRFLDYLSRSMGKLEEAALNGGPVIDLLRDKQQQDIREFTLAMHNYAALRGQELTHFLDTGGCKTLLDLGCGPGTYAFALGRHNPALELYLLDLPEILEVTREVQSRYELSNRIDYLPIDVTRQEIPGTYDIVLLSNTLHMLGEQVSRDVLSRLFGSVKPGGSLVVQAQYIDDDRQGGRWPVFLDLVQLCITPAGRNHGLTETREWMEQAGFTNVQHSPMSILNTNGFLRGYRE